MAPLPLRDAFKSSGFFVLRTPLLPIEELLGLLSAAADASRASLRIALQAWAERPDVREALWIASPELMQALGSGWDGPDRLKARKLEQALYRYLARMTARATPFGAFAGCSTGTIGDVTRLELPPRSDYRLRTRLDMETLGTLAEKLAADPTLRGKLRFRTNTSSHRVGGRFHHVQITHPRGLQVVQSIATDATSAVEATLSRAVWGATAEALAAAVKAEDPEITEDEAAYFLAQLIDSQLLMPDLRPPVTEAEPLLHVAAHLEAAQAMKRAAELRALVGDLHALDQHPLGSDRRDYGEIQRQVEHLGGAFKAGRLVQVDLFKPASGMSLDHRLAQEILDAVDVLHAMQVDPGPPHLDAFKTQFLDRYQDQEVALLEALDDEAGIGFEQEDNPTSEPLIAEIDFIPTDADAFAAERGISPVLAERLTETLARKEPVLELEGRILDALRARNPLPLPDAFAVMGAVFTTPSGRAGFRLQSAFGPSGANLLTRFCDDGPLAALVQSHLQEEESLREGAIFAEIVHLPEGRVGNVIRRPSLRAYEIPLQATPGVPPDRQLPLSDLTLSVRSGRIILRSRRHQTEVIPRLTSAHHFAGPRSWKLYKFLCLLQHQGTCSEVFFDWGALADAPFLPRVTMGNIVVSPARWRVDSGISQDLLEGRIALRAWREQARIPRCAFVTEGDQQLLIDFDNPMAEDTFIDLLRKQEEVLLTEWFPGPDALSVQGPEGRFVHEMILPFVRRHPRMEDLRPTEEPAAPEAIARQPLLSLARNPNAEGPVAPASDWLFVKLYCSPSHADLLLTELIRPLTAHALATGAADRWFVMRYADPDWHLRLRFHGDPATLADAILPELDRLATPFRRARMLWRTQFDHYEPEVDRYGGPQGIGLAERIFQIDSELCLDLMPLVMDEAGADLRWKLAFCGTDRLLAGLGFRDEEKRALVARLRETRETGWIVDGTYRQQVANAFRSLGGRDLLPALLTSIEANERGQKGGLLPARAEAAFHRFSAQLRTLRGPWAEVQATGKLTSEPLEIATSLAHMHMNRLFRSCHLQQEAVVCDFLARTYAARLARRGRDEA